MGKSAKGYLKVIGGLHMSLSSPASTYPTNSTLIGGNYDYF